MTEEVVLVVRRIFTDNIALDALRPGHVVLLDGPGAGPRPGLVTGLEVSLLVDRENFL